MSFWEDLSPGVKRYAIIGALLLVSLLAFRTCVTSTSTTGADLPKRGLRK
jgi:hypothetical protein